MAAPSLKHLTAGDLDHELTLTRRVLERVPDDHLGWQPHEKSWTLGGLAAHLANLPLWMTATLRSDGFDLAAAPPPQSEPDTRDAILSAFDEKVAVLREAFEATDDAALTETWTLRHGERIVSARPRAEVLRSWGISHMIHHRGQLTVYLRLLDVPVPSTYGPTADENMSFGNDK